MADTKLELALSLNHITDLFRAPELDPFHNMADDRSGVEQILDELKANPSARQVSVTLQVPLEQWNDDLQTQTRAALNRYADARVQRQKRELAALERKGIRALQIGLVFWGVCLLLSILFFGMEALPDFWSHFLGEGFLIAGWVGLWYPIEVLLFERWEMKRNGQYYERLKQLTLEIHSAR